MIRIFFLIILLVAADDAAAQNEDYYRPGYLRFEDYTYHPNIRTVILEKEGEPMSMPVIMLGSNEKLVLSFDLIEEEPATLAYTLVHCGFDWKPTPIGENEYLEGFSNEQIFDYRHSQNTLLNYWHYRITLPGEQMRPVLSGNYILQVYAHPDRDSILLTRRFCIAENRVTIRPDIHRATLAAYRSTHQEVDFRISLNALVVQNPYQDLKVRITQNGNPFSSIENLKPLFATSDLLDYNYEEDNLFEGGNEFRNFDLRTTRFETQFVSSFITDSVTGLLTAILKPDLRRSAQRYSVQNDLDGGLLNVIYDNRDARYEGDYLQVVFSLKAPPAFTDKPVYIQGRLTDWRTDQPYRMEYNPASGCFEQRLYLKQGYYDYRYITMDKEAGSSTLETEGSHSEAGNQYEISVYWKAPGTRYDQLIGYSRTKAGGL